MSDKLQEFYINVIEKKYIVKYRQISAFDSWVESIEKLDVSNTECDYVPSLPNLKSLTAKNCNIRSLPQLPNVQEINIPYNELVELYFYPMCKHLYADHNNLTLVFPGNYLTIDLSYNNLETLPLFPKALSVKCTHNNIKEFYGGENLQYLYIRNNPIKNLRYVKTPIFCDL